MRLHPRNIKRMMFSCVQCGQCLSACDLANGHSSAPPRCNGKSGEQACARPCASAHQELKEVTLMEETGWPLVASGH
jgi:ferredoxin-type protein NapH